MFLLSTFKGIKYGQQQGFPILIDALAHIGADLGKSGYPPAQAVGAAAAGVFNGVVGGVGVPAELRFDGGFVHATFIALFLPISENFVVTFINTDRRGSGDAVLTVAITVELEVRHTHRMHVLPEDIQWITVDTSIDYNVLSNTDWNVT